MPNYEVFIPARDEAGFDMTFRVAADNWMAALKTGMEKIGQQGPGGNILCDIKEDNSIHVTDPGTGRVFRIRELAETSPGIPGGAGAATQPGMPAHTAPPPAAAPRAVPPQAAPPPSASPTQPAVPPAQPATPPPSAAPTQPVAPPAPPPPAAAPT
ncbi:MAG: hypothetical protein D6729_04515, partial [Deltaproteobacteria bacterium]